MYFVSHVGGHRWSANVLVYRRGNSQDLNEGEGAGDVATRREGPQEATGEATQCIWLARVRPEDCEGIVKFTVLKGKVVKPERQLRGGFDRVRGVASW